MKQAFACNKHLRTREQWAAGVLAIAAALLTSFGWTIEAVGQGNVKQVGILAVDVDVNGEVAKQWWKPFQRTLADQGWIEGKNVAFVFRKPSGSSPEFTDAANELVRLKVDVIWAISTPAVRAAYAATRTVPIVALDFTTDPVSQGYIESYARPGGNLTGVFLDAPEFAGKWVELLKAIVPGLSRVAVLWDPSPGPAHRSAVERATLSFGVKAQVIEVRKPADIDRAFASMRGHPQALIILPSPLLYFQNNKVAALALKHRLLATSLFRLFVQEGGTLAYGPDQAWASARDAVLVAKILNGSKAADLPVERPEKFQLVVNLKTARAIGITIPQSILVNADEVIR
ncbi:MAG TPA: ABC transporter substrate-binding protein [Burkholderiales bacterium]|nr:ABC transporter substrate-binding protein [Burkholderiales bacterium]